MQGFFAKQTKTERLRAAAPEMYKAIRLLLTYAYITKHEHEEVSYGLLVQKEIDFAEALLAQIDGKGEYYDR
ncbi:MAG: hypothetical protein IJ697_06640 [Synergistaceae bacterium]|nr:hypothetical protein [Synergistaceae bacterium]